MGRSVSARPPADEKESPGKEKPEEKPDQKPEDEKPDEKREQPSFRPSKQDPFYLGLRLDLRKARRDARRKSDNARRRQRWATDADFRDRCRARSHGLSLQDYRAMFERQGKVCGICKTPGKPLGWISRSRVQQEPAPNAGESPDSRHTAAVFVDLVLQIHRTGGGGGKSQGNLQENSGPATCPLQACRPNCS